MSIGVSGEKPKKPHQLLGPDVTISTQAQDPDPWANKMLNEIGKTITPAGMDYMGSVAVHIYKTSSLVALDTYELAMKNQFAVGDMNSHILATAISNFNLEFQRSYLGRSLKTTDSKDKR